MFGHHWPSERPDPCGSFVKPAFRAMTLRAMSSRSSRRSREDALRRAEKHSPFLRQALQALPPVAEAFLSDGAAAAAEFALAAEADNLEAELRRKRHGLALAVALGDLAGELPLEDVTRPLSDFADFGDRPRRRSGHFANACRTPSQRASPSSRWASSAATSSITHPTSTCCCCSTPMCCRGAPVTSPAKRPCGSAGGSSSCCRSGRPTAMSSASISGCALRRSHADRAAVARRDLAL